MILHNPRVKLMDLRARCREQGEVTIALDFRCPALRKVTLELAAATFVLRQRCLAQHNLSFEQNNLTVAQEKLSVAQK